MGLLAIPVTLFLLIAPWWAISAVIRQRRELRVLRERLDALERRIAQEGVAPAPAPVAETHAVPLPQPIPPPPPTLTPSPPPAAQRAFDSSRAEELVGSVWLQNIGAILLLLGVFFLILWGYTNGRIGPGVLVASGVALGATVIWRGDRMARRLPLFGHALIGIGVGIAYLSLYLGHFTLHVLPSLPAFVLLTLLSITSVAIGLHYRVQTIAVLGVVGAFLPQLMAAWIPLHGFTMSPPELLAYMAVIDGLVFILAARAGWSALALAALVLSAFTWIAALGTASWGWGMQIGLVTLFTGLGLTPLPRLVRRPDPIPAVDLAVVAVAPICLIACSWPILAGAERIPVAMMLLTLALVQLVAALWVDARREGQELWRPLTGAAIVFLTVALERALGRERTPMAWCIEGTILVWIGLRARGGWLRASGSAVTAIGVLWMMTGLFSTGEWDRGDLPAIYPAGIRDLVCLASVLAGGWLLLRARERLSPGERMLPELWAGVGNLLLASWIGREAHHLALALYSQGGRWAAIPDPAAPRGDQRVNTLTLAMVGAAWLAQAVVLVRIGVRAGRPFFRQFGYLFGVVAGLVIFFGMCSSDGWSSDQLPVSHPVALVQLGGIVLMLALAAHLAHSRTRLGPNEQNIPEVWTVLGCLILLMWTSLESGHLARYLTGVPGRWGPYALSGDRQVLPRVRVLTAVFTSAGWLVQAAVLLALGWFRNSAFLRWMGLGLFGITVLKFLLADLQTVDVFWRFLTALVVGAALLAVSYAYQRRTRVARKAA